MYQGGYNPSWVWKGGYNPSCVWKGGYTTLIGVTGRLYHPHRCNREAIPLLVCIREAIPLLVCIREAMYLSGVYQRWVGRYPSGVYQRWVGRYPSCYPTVGREPPCYPTVGREPPCYAQRGDQYSLLCTTRRSVLPVLPQRWEECSLFSHNGVIPAVVHPWVIPAVVHPWVIPAVCHTPPQGRLFSHNPAMLRNWAPTNGREITVQECQEC